MRQDLIRDEAGQAPGRSGSRGRRARCSAGPILPQALHAVQYFGSHTDSEDAPPCQARQRGAAIMSAIDNATDDRVRGRSLPPPRAASARAHRRAEHRPDEPRRLLPQLPVQLVSGGGGRERLALSKDEAREIVYGMPYAEWQARHQTEARPSLRESPAFA